MENRTSRLAGCATRRIGYGRVGGRVGWVGSSLRIAPEDSQDARWLERWEVAQGQVYDGEDDWRWWRRRRRKGRRREGLVFSGFMVYGLGFWGLGFRVGTQRVKR